MKRSLGGDGYRKYITIRADGNVLKGRGNSVDGRNQRFWFFLALFNAILNGLCPCGAVAPDGGTSGVDVKIVGEEIGEGAVFHLSWNKSTRIWARSYCNDDIRLSGSGTVDSDRPGGIQWKRRKDIIVAETDSGRCDGAGPGDARERKEDKEI